MTTGRKTCSTIEIREKPSFLWDIFTFTSFGFEHFRELFVLLQGFLCLVHFTEAVFFFFPFDFFFFTLVLLFP